MSIYLGTFGIKEQFQGDQKVPYHQHWLYLDFDIFDLENIENISRVSNIESNDSQNVGLEVYNNIFDRIFPYFTTPSIKITLG